MKRNKGRHNKSLAKILPLVEALPQADKFQLMQSLLTQLAWEQGLFLQAQAEPKISQGRRMAAVLQRMADRQAVSCIDDPATWQQEIRKDRALPGRE